MKKIAIIFIGIFLAGVVFLLFKSSEFYNKIYTPKKNHVVKEKTTYNILLFGYGGGKHEGAYLTDTIMLFHVDLRLKKAVLFSIPRDLWVKLPTKSGADFHMKINALYQLELGEIGDVSTMYPDLNQSQFGSRNDAEFTKYILSQSLGVPIDYYGTVDFEGFKKAIDVLGGVDVNILNSFEDPEYPVDGKEKELCDKQTEELFKKVETFLKPGFNPNERERIFKEDPKTQEFIKNATDSPELAFPCRYEKLEFKKGLTHMNGEIALKYVRSRHSMQDGSDFGRSARQQQLMKAVKDRVLSIGFVPKIIPLLDELGNHVKTDFGLDEIKKFVGLANTIKDYQFITFVISDQNLLKYSWSNNGQSILVPKEGIDQWVSLQYSVKNITEGILPTQSPISTPSGIMNK
ncbi:LCP family protein [Candidatus Roizmanbacteria bacterium]|nr:LCP family protein [Candidatus Roizmanbacteria bacterium]